MRDEVARADIDRIRAELVGLAERYAAGERSVLWPPARDLRDQLVCLLDEAPARLTDEIGYLTDRCEALLAALLH